MLKKLSALQKHSLRNARRQFRDYALYFITLLCAVSFLYAFNALGFSESFAELPQLEVLSWLVIGTTLLIVFILGWIVSYMTSYMLKRRSRELSIYMLSGISVRMIAKMLFYENLILGGAAFFPGLLAGMFLAQLLEAALRNVYGMGYVLSFRFSLPTAERTLVCFIFIFLLSLLKSRKWLRKMKLYDLLYYEKQNETKMLKGNRISVAAFSLSLCLCIAGLWIMNDQPFSSGYSTLWGMLLLVLFLLLFFASVPPALAGMIEKSKRFQYGRSSLLMFRYFNGKIRSMSMSMGILSVLLLLAITALGCGIAAGGVTQQEIRQYAFDLLILHQGDRTTIPDYDSTLSKITSVQGSYAYNLYTGADRTLLEIRNQALMEQSGGPKTQGAKRSEGELQSGASMAGTWFTRCREYQADVYIGQSDYMRLRALLGYERAELESDRYYVHCVQPLSADIRNAMTEGLTLDVQGCSLMPGGVFTEAFSQCSFYGNGYYYLVVLPDAAAADLPVLYSMYAAVTADPVDISAFLSLCDGLVLRNADASRGDTKTQLFTMLIDPEADYLSGKWAEKGNLSYRYSFLICLFYLAVILVITGAAVLSVQLLSDAVKKRQQDRLLWQLGMKGQEIAAVNRGQFLLLFAFPAVPALAVSNALIRMCARLMDQNGLSLFPDAGWIWECVTAAWILFGVLYGIYMRRCAGRILIDFLLNAIYNIFRKHCVGICVRKGYAFGYCKSSMQGLRTPHGGNDR